MTVKTTGRKDRQGARPLHKCRITSKIQVLFTGYICPLENVLNARWLFPTYKNNFHSESTSKVIYVVNKNFKTDRLTDRQTHWQHIHMVGHMNKTDRRCSLQRCRWANYWQQYCISDIKVLQRRPWQLCSEAENYGYLKSSSFRAILIVFSPPTTPKVPNSPSRSLSVLHPSLFSILGAHFRFPC